MKKAKEYSGHNIDIYKIMEVEESSTIGSSGGMVTHYGERNCTLYLKIKANGFSLTTKELKTTNKLSELEAKKLNLEEAIEIAEKLIANGFYASIDKEPLNVSKKVVEGYQARLTKQCL